jgi:hypothetical protein
MVPSGALDLWVLWPACMCMYVYVSDRVGGGMVPGGSFDPVWCICTPVHKICCVYDVCIHAHMRTCGAYNVWCC